MIYDESWGIKKYKQKRARLEEIHQINVQVLKDLKKGILRQNKCKGLFYEC
jgi:hypothetical protein